MAVIGGGPRGTSVIERLIAQSVQLGEQAPLLDIHLIEPHEAGAGHIWRTDQSRLFLMNTPCLYPTVVPVGAHGTAASPLPLSFDTWRQRVKDGAILVGDADRQECSALGSADFPSRALYGRYLGWMFAELVRLAPPNVAVTQHRKEAIGIARAGEAADGGSGAPSWRIELDDGTHMEADDVVLALGHLPTALTPEQDTLRKAAADSAQYWPPAVPGDVPWHTLPAAEPVLVRGLGLNFFDAMITLTEGRGGRFSPGTGTRLKYEASGREPQLVAASRRGVPYRAKAVLDTYIPRSVVLRFCTTERVLAPARSGVQAGFDHDVWPLLHRDALWAYYSTLDRVEPHLREGSGGAFLTQLDDALAIDGPQWSGAVQGVVERWVPVIHRLVVQDLARPFTGRHFADSEEFTAAVLAHLDADAEGSSRGEDDPLKMMIGALNAGRSVIKQAVADGGISTASWHAELQGWFEPLVEGLASGPPPVRIAQLAALVRAGIVRFVGPDPRFGVDPDEGFFRAASPWVDGEPFSAPRLTEAMMPANRVAATTSPLLLSLLGQGIVRPRVFMADDGVPVASSGLDVTGPPYRAVDRSGSVQESLFVIGLQLSSVQWGTAIAAEAGAPLTAGGRTLLDADGIAAAILLHAGATDLG
ncbi:FAD/NAD(P)-binding protein [Arthrobacter echini]|uniref:FAD/NAD(P)-binding protein n=1 Tax=Arthrobacter echini TaxID=1529066 RepID=UPI001FE50BB6|nr:FAD/NAD(P)-binding protein [Arthrobacter echini]